MYNHGLGVTEFMIGTSTALVLQLKLNGGSELSGEVE